MTLVTKNIISWLFKVILLIVIIIFKLIINTVNITTCNLLGFFLNIKYLHNSTKSTYKIIGIIFLSIPNKECECIDLAYPVNNPSI